MTLDLATAAKYAASIVEKLADMCEQIAVAGSIRRRRPQVGDIDLVIQPKAGKRRFIRDRILAWKPLLKADGHENLLVEVKGVQIDIFFADEPGQDLFAEPGNFGTLLVCRTGSLQHNIYLADRAKKLGRHWNPYRGVVQRGQIIASQTEASVFNALGLDFIKPEDRER